MENNKTVKKLKLFFSLQKEKLWLEEMAQSGYFFKDITCGGICYTFETGEPKKIVYEIDRFDLPKNPTLNQIHEKDEFLTLARELGWEEITHDADMNYYLAKDFDQDGINELYNNSEMRLLHANKFYQHFEELPKTLDKVALLISVFMLIVSRLFDVSSVCLYFSLFYCMFTVSYHMLMTYFAKLYRRELSISSEEWYLKELERKSHKVSHRFFLSSKRLCRYLTAQSEQGWHIQRITTFSCYFKKGTPETRYYTFDSQFTVNTRRRNAQLATIKDNKDISMQNNDWQHQSVADAEANGWTFICASGNLLILYDKTTSSPENSSHNHTYAWLHPWLMFYLFFGLIGFVFGIALSLFSDLL